MSILAYIDPGTVQSLFSGAGPVLATLIGFLLLVVWPFRYIYEQVKWRCASASKAMRITLFAMFIALGTTALVGGYYLIFRSSARRLADAKSLSNLTGASAARRKNTKIERVLVIGMDGLDASLAEMLMAAGELPHFKQLKDRGGYTRLATSNPAESPVAWSSIATGCDPGQHGIYDFIHRSPESYVPLLTLRKTESSWLGTRFSKPRLRDGFWMYTSAAGIPTTVVRWPVGFPAEKVSGRFLAGFGVPDLLGGEGRYTYFTNAEVASDDPSQENVTTISWDGNRGSGKLRGPVDRRKVEVTQSISFSRGEGNRLRIALADQSSAEVDLHQWSAWLPVSFTVGLGNTVHGQVKFYLAEIEPHLRVVTSPIHLDPIQQAFPLTWPPSYGKELRDRLGPFHTLGMPEQIHPLSHGRYDYAAFLAECQAVSNERRRMLHYELERFEQGLLAFVFDTTDRVQHAFWGTQDPEYPAYLAGDAQRYGQVIPDTYREMDKVVAEILTRVDDKTLLLLLSDHGFGPFRRSVHVNRWLIERGFMHLKGNDTDQMQDLFKNVDWSRTTAYACGFTGVYLNLATREEQGKVDPIDGYADVLRQLADELRRWRDPQTGRLVLKNVYLNSELYQDGQIPQLGPDLILGFDVGYRASWRTALGGAPANLIEDNTSRWSGDHLVDPMLVPGVLFCNKRVDQSQPQLIDICPTILNALGVECPPHLQGHSLFSFSD